MSTVSQDKRAVAAASLLALGLVLGFGIAQLGSALAGLEEGRAAAGLAERSPVEQALPETVPQGRFVEVAETVGPAVVFIQAEHSIDVPSALQRFPFDDFFRFFGDDPPRQEEEPEEQVRRSQGSGVLVDPAGYIVTNAHVVSIIEVDPDEQETVTVETIQANQITVRLKDDEEYEAEIVGIDIGTDVAVLRISADSDFPSARLGDSDRTQVGEWVMALGAPFGLTNTVSAGIISAKGRAQLPLQATHYQDFLQTDAAINPGNSGGPLVNLQGEVVGINTAIATNGLQQQFAGVGFASPINLVRRVMEALIEDGRVVRGWIGVLLHAEGLDRDTAEAFGLEIRRIRGAVLLDEVNPGEPADQAGLRPGDIVTHMNGERLNGNQDFIHQVGLVRPDESVILTVLRDGQERTVEVTLSERPSEEEIYRRGIARQSPGAGRSRRERTADSGRLGLTVTELTSTLAQQLGYEGEGGVLVSSVVPNGAADRAGIVRGDIILDADRQPVDNEEEFEAALAEVEPGDVVLLRVRRPNGAYSFVAPRMPEE